jgi:GT2 family glycosyltransferase
MDGDRLKELAFDFYERYILLEPIGKTFRPRQAPYRILDVGGHTPAFWAAFSSVAGTLIPDSSVAVADVHPRAELKNYIQATGLALPFPDESFDLVCSLDTLEHLPGEDRPAFLAELLRVTRDGLYVAFPFDSPGNRRAESMLADYTSVLLNYPVRALLEHRRFGLPDRARIDGLLAAGPYPWIGFQQCNTDVWLSMMLAYHSLRTPDLEFVRELNRRFNQVYAAQDWAAPAYRAGYVLSKRRRPADLQALRASFGSPEKRADLQAVLAFCQPFLNIARNGRVEAREELRTRLEKTAAELGRTRLALAQKELENSELSDSISQIVTQLEKLPKQVAGLQETVATLAGQSARLDDRMRQLEIGLVTNKRAVQAIYDSRIWKTLSGLGGLALRWAGRKPNHRSPAGMPAHGAPWSRRPAAATGEFMALVCDYPGTLGIVPVCEVVEIRGWALAKSGIERVSIQFNDGPPATAVYGILRQDVGREHQDIAGSDYSGYRFFWDTTGLPEGPCTVRITAVAHSGRGQELVSHVMVDWNSSPGYDLWIARHEPAVEEKRRMRADVDKFAVRPCISVVVPVYKTPIAILTRCLRSVTDQIYPHWELCLADDASGDPAIAALLQEHTRRDSRIRATTLPENLGISGATNEALRISTGGYIAFLDHDDQLADFALWEVVRAINESPDTDLFYSDEDKIDQSGRRYDAFFKPGWSPDLFLSCNYICHFVVLKRSLLDRLGGLNESYNGAQDYEFLLRAIEHTRKIKRIPRVLYHWRAITGSTAKASAGKPHASIDGKRALSSHLARTAPGATVELVKTCRYRVHYPIPENPRITILMPTNGRRNLFRTALEDILEKTSYKNYDIVLIDNSRTARIEQYVASLARKAPVSCFDWRGRPFNFSMMNNAAARASESPYILFLNDDVTVIAAEWLTAMLEHAQRRDVGAVGAQLWYPNDAIQHAGVVMGLYGNCSHAFKNLAAGRPHYFDLPDLIRNCSAVTAACLLVGREKFFRAGGFDEINLAVAFQDVDLCLKLLELGYRNVYTPYAKLYHHESATKTENEKIPDPAEDAFMKKKWAKYIADDPYYNPNLARGSEDFSLAAE